MTSEIVYSGSLRTEARHVQSGTVIETDAPIDNQGRGERFSPSDLLTASLGSCMMTIMGIKARDMGVDLTGTRLEVTKTMASDPRRVSAIDVKFHFPESLMTDEKQQLILERAAHTCPVAQSIHPDIRVTVDFNWAAHLDVH